MVCKKSEEDGCFWILAHLAQVHACFNIVHTEPLWWKEVLAVLSFNWWFRKIEKIKRKTFKSLRLRPVNKCQHKSTPDSVGCRLPAGSNSFRSEQLAQSAPPWQTRSFLWILESTKDFKHLMLQRHSACHCSTSSVHPLKLIPGLFF